MKRIKKNDVIKVIAGRDKGKVAKVLSVTGETVFVEGVNLVSKHVKPNPNLNIEGGIVKKEAAIHVSNVAIYNANTGKADKVSFKLIEVNGKLSKVRVYRSSQEQIQENRG